MTDLLIQTAGALAVVVLLIAAAAWAYRKRAPGVSGFMRLIAYHPFGPRRGIAAVRVGREVLIVGVTNADLKLFRVIEAGKLDEGQGPAADISEKVRRLRKMKEDLDA